MKHVTYGPAGEPKNMMAEMFSRRFGLATYEVTMTLPGMPHGQPVAHVEKNDSGVAMQIGNLGFQLTREQALELGDRLIAQAAFDDSPHGPREPDHIIFLRNVDDVVRRLQEKLTETRYGELSFGETMREEETACAKAMMSLSGLRQHLLDELRPEIGDDTAAQCAAALNQAADVVRDARIYVAEKHSL